MIKTINKKQTKLTGNFRILLPKSKGEGKGIVLKLNVFCQSVCSFTEQLNKKINNDMAMKRRKLLMYIHSIWYLESS